MELKALRISDKKIEILNNMNIFQAEDLLTYYPFRYEVSEFIPRKDWQKDMKISMEAMIITHAKVIRFRGKQSITRFKVVFEEEEFDVSIFNRPWVSAFEVGIIRSIISVPAHMMFAVIMGYYISKYRFTSSKAKKRKYLTLSIVLPILLHGVFDFILMIQYRWSIIVFIVYIVYLWKSSLDKLDEYTNNSRKKFLKRYKFIRHKKRKDD